MKTKPSAFIVLYDDEQGYTNPYSWDPDCLGALSGMSDDPVALFQTRKQAQQAIRISARYAALCQAQRKPVNEDFTSGLKNVKIAPANFAPL